GRPSLSGLMRPQRVRRRTVRCPAGRYRPATIGLHADWGGSSAPGSPACARRHAGRGRAAGARLPQLVGRHPRRPHRRRRLLRALRLPDHHPAPRRVEAQRTDLAGPLLRTSRVAPAAGTHPDDGDVLGRRPRGSRVAVRLRHQMVSGGATWLRVYGGFDTRADALLAGCALALGAHLAAGRRPPMLPVAVAALLGAGCLARIVVDPSPYHWLEAGGFTLVAICAAALLAALVVRPVAPLVAVFALPPLVEIGRVSY